MIDKVVLTRKARKQLSKLPQHVVVKLKAWVDAVERQGLAEIRRVPGFHDEPLRGRRQGQRSIRLSRAYRAIYEVRSDSVVEFASIEEVGKHEY